MRYIFNSESDDDSTKKGGLGEKVLGDNLKILEFLEMKHGWTTRGGLKILLYFIKNRNYVKLLSRAETSRAKYASGGFKTFLYLTNKST